MKWKRLLDFVCLFFAAVSVVVGIRMMGRADVVPLTDPSGLGVSDAVGTFLPALVALIAGLWLLGKSKEN